MKIFSKKFFSLSCLFSCWVSVLFEFFHILDVLLDIISVFRVCCGSFSEGRGPEGHHQLGTLWIWNRNFFTSGRFWAGSGSASASKQCGSTALGSTFKRLLSNFIIMFRLTLITSLSGWGGGDAHGREGGECTWPGGGGCTGGGVGGCTCILCIPPEYATERNRNLLKNRNRYRNWLWFRNRN